MNVPVNPYLDLLRSYLRPQRWRVLGLAVLLFGGIGLQLLNPQIMRAFIDTAQAGGSLRALVLAGLLFLVVVLLQQVVAIAAKHESENVAWTATNALRQDLTLHVLKLDMAFHNAHTPGELMERIDGDVDRLANFFSEFVLQIVGGVLLTVGVLLLLFREDWIVGATMTLFAIVYAIVHTRGQQMATPYWREERQLTAELFGFVEERVGGARDIQTSGAVAYTMRRFYDIVRRRLWQALKADVVTDVGWSISNIFYDLGVVTAMGLGAYLYQTGVLTIGSVYLILYYLAMLSGPLNRIARQLEDLQQVRVAVERVRTLLQTRPEIADGPGTALSGGGPLAVAFEHVSFGYHNGNQALADVSFRLQPGQVLGLLGRTGSGKTTLSRLLFRLYDAAGGGISVNGADIRQTCLADLRREVGMVTQDVQLFQASVRDNLTLFDPAIGDERILDALHTLGLEAWLQTLPDGLDSQLAANGGGLSAGEAQLLVLTRVFLRDPGLIILDEASSRLDPATERLLEQAVDRLLRNRTAIIIAHRLATVRRADQILILDQGRVVECGAYGQLAANPDSVLSHLLKTGLQEVLA